MNIKCGFVETAGGLPCRIDGWNLLEQGLRISFGCSRHITEEDQAKYSLLCEAWLNGRNGKPQLEQRRGFDAGWVAGKAAGIASEQARVGPLVAQIEQELELLAGRLEKALGGSSAESSSASFDWEGRDLLKLSKRVARM